MSRMAMGQSSTAPNDGAPPSYAGELLFLEIYKLVHFFLEICKLVLFTPRCSPW